MARTIAAARTVLGWAPTQETDLVGLWGPAQTRYSDPVSQSATTPTTTDGGLVRWWADGVGGRTLHCKDDTGRGLYRPTGAFRGKSGVEWDASTDLLFHADGTVLSGSAFTLAVVASVVIGQSAKNALAGRSEYNGNGTGLFVSAANQLYGQVVTSGVVVLADKTAGGADRTVSGVPQTVGLTYTGANSYFQVLGGASQSSAQTGALAFHASDTAFWVGGSTAGGAVVAFNKLKSVSLVALFSGGRTAAQLTVLLTKLARYGGGVDY